MKDYELSVLFHPDLEMNLDPALDKVKKLIETSGGKIIKEELEGKKRLAFPIKGQDFAVFYFFDLQLPSEAPQKISSTFNITDEILRAMIVKTDPKKAKYAALKKEQSTNEGEESDTKEGEE